MSAWLKISGISGILTPIIAFTFISTAIIYSPQFSWTENALSDLGIQEGITAVLFNYGLIISGALTLVFASGLFTFLSGKLLGKIGTCLLILAALSLIAIGIFPENIKPTHFYVSVAFFVLSLLSMFIVSAAFLFANEIKMGLFTFLTATIATTIWITYFLTHFVSGDAIPETVSALSASLWSMMLGYKMLKEDSHSKN